MPTIQVDPTTNKPCVPLPEPFSAFSLSLRDHSDAPSIHAILRDAAVSGNLSGAPEPYTLKDAEYFLSIQPSNDVYLTADWSSGDPVLPKDRVPFCTIRNSEDRLVGDVSVRRNNWEWMATYNAERRRLLKEENEAKEAGDPSIQYSIGFYLKPKLQSRGLMTAALRTSLALAKYYMNAQYFEGICLVENTASRRVLEKNGLVYREEAIMPWKNGRNATVAVLERPVTLE